jgi:chromosome segregation ATPase
MTDPNLVTWLRSEGYVHSADEVEQLILSKAALQTEIERLREILDGTERREAEYLALIEKHATENEELKAQIARLGDALLEAEKFIFESGVKLGEAHAEISRLKAGQDWQRGENERLKAERHTVKRMLQDILDKHGVR